MSMCETADFPKRYDLQYECVKLNLLLKEGLSQNLFKITFTHTKPFSLVIICKKPTKQ